MNVLVDVPPSLRRLCGGETNLLARPGSVADIVVELSRRFHGLGDRLCDPHGTLRGSVLVLVNDEDIRFLDCQRTAVVPGDRLSFVPAFAGG
jgi:molybdopterin synthase sulfur carrier subunit